MHFRAAGPNMAGAPTMAKLLCVYCGSSMNLESRYYAAAEAVGRSMVANGWGLVYGGGNLGLLGSLARAVKDAGGHVVGVIQREAGDLPQTLGQLLVACHQRLAQRGKIQMCGKRIHVARSLPPLP